MPKFPLGRLVTIPGALSELERVGISPEEVINPRGQLDPGGLDARDQQRDLNAVENDDRAF